MTDELPADPFAHPVAGYNALHDADMLLEQLVHITAERPTQALRIVLAHMTREDLASIVAMVLVQSFVPDWRDHVEQTRSES